MKLLIIIHATSWSDKKEVAKRGIEKLISNKKYNHVIELIQSQDDIYQKRYLSHNGIIYKHDQISPINFLENNFLGTEHLMPLADEITLVGGVLNKSGGGCFNVTFEHIISFLKRKEKKCNIIIPLSAVYTDEGSELINEDNHNIEQYLKDIVWKLITNNVPFDFDYNKYTFLNGHSLIDLTIII